MNWTFRELAAQMPLKVPMFAVSCLHEGLRLSLPVLSCLLVDSLSASAMDWDRSVCLLASLMGVAVAIVGIAYVKGVLEAHSFAAFDRNLLLSYWRTVERLDVEEFSRIPVGTWMGKLSYDVNTAGNLVRQVFGDASGIFVFWVGSSALIAFQNAWMLLFLLFSVFAGLVVWLLFRRRIRNAAERMRKSAYRQSDMVYGLVRMLPLMSVMGALERYRSPLKRVCEMAFAREKRFLRVSIQGRTLLDVALWLVRGTVVAICMARIASGTGSVGEMVAFMVLMEQVASGVVSLMQIVPVMEGGLEALGEIRQTAESATNDSSPGGVRAPSGTSFNGGIVRCTDVSFAYSEAAPVVRGFTTSLRHGDFCVFLGRNGTGKSTLAKLLLGVLRPIGGEVETVDCRIGWIPQELEVRGERVLDAVRLRDESISAERVGQIMRLCGLSEWVGKLPCGVYSRISSETMSGGQLQLLSIARALVLNPDFLVVDEISNNLDIVMKQKVYDVLKSCAKGRCVVLISHDIESVRLANRLFFFGKNGIEELPKGTTEDDVRRRMAQ